ncbi:MAG: hypothetical protein RL026_2497 [Pseudomonadota bacterium]|jgi:alkylated DNA repair protein (DNA oxidative demethylase)
MQGGLFDDHAAAQRLSLDADAWLLPGFALPLLPGLSGELAAVTAAAPWRHMRTPGGRSIAAAMTNCGAAGWVSDRQGYRYASTDPDTGLPWPPMPAAFRILARTAAALAGFPGFEPDACLINRYAPGAGMGLHQDRDEADLTHPIVSVSLGLPAVFLWGGVQRSQRARRVPLQHGDVVVWGGHSRLFFHGIAPVAAGVHPFTGTARINLTFRKALAAPAAHRTS